MENQNNIAVKIVFDAFKSNLKRSSKILSEITDEQLLNEIVPSKNTGHYVLGHLVATHDYMIPLLGFGDKLFPELEEIFIKNPDKSGLQKPSIAEIRKQFEDVHNELLPKLESLTTEQWFEKHTLVSDEDFEKEPHRNRLNVVLNRASHLAYHIGQIVLLKKQINK